MKNEADMTREEVEQLFSNLRETEPRKAAEVAYVLARLYLNEGNTGKATEFGRESIWLFDQFKLDTLEEAAANYAVLGGVGLPEYIHQEVVRDRLKPLNL